MIRRWQKPMALQLDELNNDRREIEGQMKN